METGKRPDGVEEQGVGQCYDEGKGQWCSVPELICGCKSEALQEGVRSLSLSVEA